MTTSIAERLDALGITLPQAAAPAANYLPAVISGNHLYTSGQLPLREGALVSKGLVGRDLDVAGGQEAAKWCAVNILAQANAALGDLARIEAIVKISVFVASAPGFTEQHLVANGASDFLVEVLGDVGRHARSAVGMAALPLDAPVEIEAVLRFSPEQA
ncbi:RidA family protein [Oricola sp.]|uniref:RidA family protein n=1 Tax=Oricola sp. TaxID=1979950 RepID=UPI0025FF4ED4|nr:RidA family protein [Oricola sp.]MCI5076994.1 RidA family protein [Oricola sp.]